MWFKSVGVVLKESWYCLDKGWGMGGGKYFIGGLVMIFVCIKEWIGGFCGW